MLFYLEKFHKTFQPSYIVLTNACCAYVCITCIHNIFVYFSFNGFIKNNDYALVNRYHIITSCGITIKNYFIIIEGRVKDLSRNGITSGKGNTSSKPLLLLREEMFFFLLTGVPRCLRNCTD